MQTSIKTEGFRSLAEGEAVEFLVEVSTPSGHPIRPERYLRRAAQCRAILEPRTLSSKGFRGPHRPFRITD